MVKLNLTKNIPAFQWNNTTGSSQRDRHMPHHKIPYSGLIAANVNLYILALAMLTDFV